MSFTFLLPVFLIGGGDGTESHDLLPAGCGRRCELAAGGRGGRDEGEDRRRRRGLELTSTRFRNKEL